MKTNQLFVIGAVAAALLWFCAFAVWKSKSSEPVAQGVDPMLLIRAHSPIKGDMNAPVTLVEFLDPECEACRSMHPIVKRLLAEYQGKVRLVIRYMPFHQNSLLAASALEEAREQGKFDQALDLLFEKQPQWGDHHAPRPELIPVLLKEIGMDEKTLDPKALIAKHGGKVETDKVDGENVGVRFTPTFFVNGKIINEIGYEPLKAAIEAELPKTGAELQK